MSGGAANLTCVAGSGTPAERGASGGAAGFVVEKEGKAAIVVVRT